MERVGRIKGAIWRCRELLAPTRCGGREASSNKGMKLTNLSAAPGETEAPPRAFRRFAAVRTGSQLIPGVRPTQLLAERRERS